MHDEDEDLEEGFKMDGENDDEPMDDVPEDMDFGLDEEDPEKDS